MAYLDELTQKDVTPLLMHWSYIFPALTNRSDIEMLSKLSEHCAHSKVKYEDTDKRGITAMNGWHWRWASKYDIMGQNWNGILLLLASLTLYALNCFQEK